MRKPYRSIRKLRLGGTPSADCSDPTPEESRVVTKKGVRL